MLVAVAMTAQLLALCKIVFITLYAVVKEPRISENSDELESGGQDWTRTSDPRLIKAVL